jgi:hypothetical protein
LQMQGVGRWIHSTIYRWVVIISWHMVWVSLLMMLRQPLICLLRVNGMFGLETVTGVRGTGSHPDAFRYWWKASLYQLTFGEAEESWHWQSGGSVEIAKAGKTKISLRDLTGFDGRCDAIYFTQESNPSLPEDDLKELSDWKDELTGRADEKIEELSFDLVVVGGGMSGCGAALAARSQGLKVALIQDRPLFGGNASQEIRVHTLGIHGYGSDILKIDRHIPLSQWGSESKNRSSQKGKDDGRIRG